MTNSDDKEQFSTDRYKRIYIAIAIAICILWIVAIWFLLLEWPSVGLVGGIISIVVLLIPGLGPLASIVITLIAAATGGWGQKLNPIIQSSPIV